MQLASGLILPPRPATFISSSSIFVEDATKLARAEKALSESRVGKLTNQLHYGHPGFSGSFYGYSGMGYGGTMVSEKGGSPYIKGENASDPIWCVPYQQPRVKVWLVQEGPLGPEREAEETLRTGEVAERIQGHCEAVPMPTLALIPKGRLHAIGADSNCIIWCPATDELWEFHRLSTFKTGAHAGEYKAGYGCYIAKASEWNGICPPEEGQLSASHLSHASGCINFADLVKVARGEEIDHALGLTLYVLLNEHVAPATKNDSQKNSHEYLEDGVTPNPAYTTEGPEGLGSFDGIPEGSWFAYPAASKASEFSALTRPLEKAIYEAGRKHGFVVTDKGGTPGLSMSDPVTLFTPYNLTAANPLAGSAIFSKYAYGEKPGEKAIPTALREAWTDPTLTAFTGELNGTAGVMENQPWGTLELLAPRTS